MQTETKAKHTPGPTEAELLAALARAGKLIDWMSNYIGQMAPGKYQDCFVDLNEHGLFMRQNRIARRAAVAKAEGAQ